MFLNPNNFFSLNSNSFNLLCTRNSRFAGFLGALHALLALSATGVWAAPKLNIFQVLPVSYLAIVKKVFLKAVDAVAATSTQNGGCWDVSFLSEVVAQI